MIITRIAFTVSTVIITLGFMGPSAWGQTAANKNVMEVKDVESLNDDLGKFSGKVVRVKGQIQDKLDARAVILESGGIFNDEIVVLTGPNLKGPQVNALNENTEVVVTGTLFTKPLAELKRTYSWNVDKDTEQEFSDVKAYLIADEISVVHK